MKHRNWIALLAALALTASLLAGCGGPKDPIQQPPAPDPAPAEGENLPASDSGPLPSKEEPPEQSPPAEEPPAEGEEPGEPAEIPPEEPVPDPPEPEEQAPSPEAAPEPEETVPEDGAYTASVTLEGGTGRASVASPAALRCENGQFWATLVWSSPNFDYMKVDGERYGLISEPGSNSTFEIPVSAFDAPLPVIADTVAMSEPHEVEYTLCFDSSTLQKQ